MNLNSQPTGDQPLLFRNKSDRPRINPGMTPADWLAEGVALLVLLFFIGYVIYNYRLLPATIPTHFNARGEADGFGGKASVFILPVTTLSLYLLMTLINRVPYIFNFPVTITPSNARKQYGMATRLIRLLKLVIIVLFFYICYSAINSARGKDGLGLWFMPVFLALVFIPLIVYLVMAMRKQ